MTGCHNTQHNRTTSVLRHTQTLQIRLVQRLRCHKELQLGQWGFRQPKITLLHLIQRRSTKHWPQRLSILPWILRPLPRATGYTYIQMSMLPIMGDSHRGEAVIRKVETLVNEIPTEFRHWNSPLGLMYC